MSPLVLLALATVSCSDVDADGHAFATCFDPWRGVELGGAFTVDGTGAGGAFNAGFRLRGQRESNSKADSTWLSLHQLGATSLRPVGGAVALDVTAYEGVLRRHVREGALLLPFNPPVKMPFPFDIAVHAQAVRYERRWAEGTDWNFEPLRVSLLFDPLRASTSRFNLGFGVTAAYRLRQVSDVVLHEVTPLTAGTVVFSFESEEGRWFARGVVSCGGSFIAPTPTFTFRARGEMELSRVVFAVADQPLAVFVRGSAAWRDAGARETSEWAVHAGLTLRLFSAR